MPCSFLNKAVLGCALALSLAAVAPAAPQQQPDPLENSIDRWNRMSPEERERELAKLPPARARLIRQRLRRYAQMNPEEQQALRKRYKTFSELPPEKQQVIRQRVLELRGLPPGRRLVVHKEVEQMRAMPEGQRDARFNSPDFRNRYSPEEQQIIHDLTEYLQGPA